MLRCLKVLSFYLLDFNHQTEVARKRETRQLLYAGPAVAREEGFKDWLDCFAIGQDCNDGRPLRFNWERARKGEGRRQQVWLHGISSTDSCGKGRAGDVTAFSCVLIAAPISGWCSSPISPLAAASVHPSEENKVLGQFSSAHWCAPGCFLLLAMGILSTWLFWTLAPLPLPRFLRRLYGSVSYKPNWW